MKKVGLSFKNFTVEIFIYLKCISFWEEFVLNTFSEERAVELGKYIVKYKATVRAAAEAFGISKSTVHMDVTGRLKKADPELYYSVREILDINKAQRHIRGGLATKEKYLKEKVKTG